MRFMLHNFCKAKGLNLTSWYGLENGCHAVKRSCHVGKRVYFEYGHQIPDFDVYDSLLAPTKSSTLPLLSRRLFVFMIREPLAWVLSRKQHAIRKEIRTKKVSSPKVGSLVDIVVEHGMEYFVFLPKKYHQLAVKWFNETVVEYHMKGMIDVQPSTSISNINTSSENIKSPFHYPSSPTGIASALERMLASDRNDKFSSGDGKDAVIALSTEYYDESVEYLDFVFDTKLFSSPEKGGFQTTSMSDEPKESLLKGFKNRARPEQEADVIASTAKELKVASRLLELHHALYQVCLKSFRQRYSAMKMQQ